MGEQKYNFVNAHINNISFPKTIEQLEDFIYEHGCYNVEDVVNEATDGYVIGRFHGAVLSEISFCIFMQNLQYNG